MPSWTDTEKLTPKQAERLAKALGKEKTTNDSLEASVKSQKPRHKFRAKPTETDGIKFSSKKEANYYLQLKQLQELGEVLFFLRQVPLHLPGNVKYLCDFLVFYADGTADFVDVKGMKTPQYVMKKKQVEALYPVEIVEV